MHAEDRRGKKQHRADRHRERERRPAQDDVDDAAPEVPFRSVGTAEVPSEVRDAERVDAVADEAQQRGQQRERRRDRDDADEDRPQREAPHDRGRDDEHAQQRDDERRAAEEHGAAGGRAGARDRVLLGEPVPALLSVTRHDEQRVVDPEREPHPREHVHDEDRERELEGDDRDEAERDDDREDRHQHGHEPGEDGPEDEHEDDQRGGEAKGELALLEIRLRLLAEVVTGRVVAGDADLEPAAVELLDDLLDCARAGVCADVHDV